VTHRRKFLQSMAGLSAAGVTLGGITPAQSATPTCTTATSVLNFIPPTHHGAIKSGTSQYDCANAIRSALTATKGGPLHFPAGRYIIGSSIRMRADDSNTAFGPGPWIVGDGIDRTIFENRATNGAMFDIDSNVDHATRFVGVLGVRLEGFTVHGRGLRGTTALRLRTSYNAKLLHLRIVAQGGDGIRIPCVVGDNDGSNMISLDQVRVENCGGWGIDTAGEPGFNETSFVRLQQVFVQACGTSNAGPVPTSGGMRHKGQILTLDQCAFTINENVALYIPGQAGLAQSIDISGTAFENNRKRHLLCTGVSGFKARNIQFYNNDANRADVACEFSGATHTVRLVDIDGVTVRATAGNNRLIGFRFSGGNLESDTCRVRNVSWENYDHPGQRRYDGVAFDPVTARGELFVSDGQTLLYRPQSGAKGNAHTPIRLRGRGSSTGEWVAKKLPQNGVYAGNSGLRPSTLYQVYLYDKDAVQALEISEARAVRDDGSGYTVKQGDATRLHIGSVMTDGRGDFAFAANGGVSPVSLPSRTPGRAHRLWIDASGNLRLVTGREPASDTDGQIVG
jgi:hypothetical protein